MSDKNKKIVLVARNVNKFFEVRDKESYTIKQNLFSLFYNKHRWKRHHALSNINIAIRDKETIGVIGRNGSGKTTLCRVLSGTYMPSKGRVITRTKPIFLSFGLGLHAQFTARENIIFILVLIGIAKKEAINKVPEILKMADLQDFENRKVGFFSSGMTARLSFFIAINTIADIIFLDEVFATGDAYFMDKIQNTFNNVILKKKTIFLVSHSMSTVLSYADRVIYMKNGKVVYFGTPKTAVEMYESDVAKISHDA